MDTDTCNSNNKDQNSLRELSGSKAISNIGGEP